MNWKSTVLVLFAALIGMTDLAAQDLKFPGMDKSPMDAAHYPRRAAFKNYLGDDDPDRTQKIKVLYCRPNKNERVVFGKLVPWGQDWRLGANEATEVTFFAPVEIGGTYIGSGTYTMFAQCYPDHWILKISKERFIAGADNRDITKDIVAVSIPTSHVPNVREAFTIGFQKVDDGNANMIFEWDQTRATLPINMNPAMMASSDASPMDLVQYPNSSRLRNYQKPEDLDKAVAKVRVVYSRPQMKGREIFGGLLKHGEMWRVGANETTVITFFEDVTIGGKAIKAGQYGLFAKVNEDNWEFIIHKNTQSWGNANHDDKDNVVTVTAKTAKTPSTVEALTILLKENGENQIDLIVAWENTMAKLPISLGSGKKS
ncbi:MAG: DUF2911 domain-containing protein [Bacteroidetes bacterium]|jgi:hypothetical protein|nr:DUF2911 domain-containing protein [Bacteroidota bacterium]